MRTKLQTFAELEALGVLSMPIFGNGFILDRLVMPCVLLIFVNPLIAPLTLWFWGVVAYTPTADEEEYDEWRGRVRHFETRVSEIVDHRSDQTEQRMSEQTVAEHERARASIGRRLLAEPHGCPCREVVDCTPQRADAFAPHRPPAVDGHRHIWAEDEEET